MQKHLALCASVALVFAVLYDPWRHVHTHGHDAHHELGLLHAHHVDDPVRLTWRSHGPDEDARRLTDAVATSGPHVVHAVAVLTSAAALVPPPSLPSVPATLGPKGHDPPPGARPKPRAPPIALPPSLA